LSKEQRRKYEELLKAFRAKDSASPAPTFWTLYGSWGFLIGIVVFIVGYSSMFMTAGKPYLADIPFFVGATIILIKLYRCPEHKRLPRKDKVRAYYGIPVLVLVVVIGSAYLNHHFAAKSFADVEFLDLELNLQRMEIAVWCQNYGEAPAKQNICLHYVWVVPVDKNKEVSIEEQDSIWTEFSTQRANSPPANLVPRTLPPGARRVKYMPMAKDKDFLKYFYAGNQTILDMGVISYSDEHGPHSVEFCKWVKPPEGTPLMNAEGLLKITYIDCRNHNVQLY